MIQEKEIDMAVEMIAEEKAFILSSNNLINKHPALIAYLNAEGFDILSEDEKDLLWYCLLVIIESIGISGEKPLSVNINDIQDAEESNYNLIGDKDMKFTQVADVLFKDYEEEDLLAFVEDTLTPDEEDFPSPVGRKVIFITLKTLIDVLTKQPT